MRRPCFRGVGTAVLSFMALAALPTEIDAQTVFAEAAGLADHDPTLRSDTNTTIGVSAGIGVSLSPRVSVRLEFDLPRWHRSESSRTARLPQRIEVRSIREENRARSISALVAGHIRPMSRLHVAVVGGGTRASRDSRRAGFVGVLDLDGRLIDHREIASDSSHTWLALTGGSDAAISLTRRLALVPQLRIHSYLPPANTPLVFVRPRVALRWQF